jgi:hypothetical protein
MGGGWIIPGGLLALALLAGGCARKDRIAPCAPGEGLVSAYAPTETVATAPLASGLGIAPADPCGPLRRLNAAPRATLAEE